MKRGSQFVSLVLGLLLLLSAGQAFAQGGGGKDKDKDKGKDKKEQKKLDKEAKKLEKQAEKGAAKIGHDKILCVLAAHTTEEFGDATALKQKLEESGAPFGLFVAAVYFAFQGDLDLDETLMALKEGKSLAQIAKEKDLDMGDLRQGFGQFRSEIARAMTNPPENCP
ncbi:MAG TPA: hypothetical protein VNO70_08365 [Blastocatellia bacterium]|nr:hypothetical protein [Blastocatellia bacterium]